MRILGWSILVVIIASVVTLFCIYPREALSTIAAILAWWLFTEMFFNLR